MEETTVYELLSKTCEEESASAQKRIVEIGERLQELADTKKETMLSAQIGILVRELEGKIATGDEEGERKFRAEIERVKEELSSITDARQAEMSELNAEKAALQSQLAGIAKSVLDDCYEALCENVFEKLEEYLQMVETTYRDVQQFAQRHSIALGSNYKKRLQLHGHNLYRPGSRELQRRVSEWI